MLGTFTAYFTSASSGRLDFWVCLSDENVRGISLTGTSSRATPYPLYATVSTVISTINKTYIFMKQGKVFCRFL